MARPRRPPAPSLSARVRAEPRRFGFFQAVRLLEGEALRGAGTHRELALVGEETDARQRTVKFSAATHLSYPQSEIDTLVEQPPAPPEIAVNFLGLTGPSGVLPQHYSVALIRELRRRNTALRDFFDLFNHRLIAFFYRAWAKYRIPISVDRGGAEGRDGATQTLRALIGFGTDGMQVRNSIGQHALLHYAGLLGHFPRNALSLERLLSDYFRLPIRIEPFAGRWLIIPPEQRSRLGGRGQRPQFAGLGIDCVLGTAYWDVQGNFAILIGPIGYREFIELMPDASMLAQLAELTRLYVDAQLGFKVRLQLRKEEIPKLRLDAQAGLGARLGWNTWVRHDPATEDACDAGWYV
jgi:type VI secretion system protein ImpH